MNWYYQKVNYLELGKPMAEVKGIYIKKLPIAVGNDDKKICIESLVNDLILLCQSRYAGKLKFINYIVKAFEPKKVTEKMENFEQMSFKEFCGELKKQKVNLTSSEQMDLLTAFEEVVDKTNEFSKKISSKYEELDWKIFELYEIDEGTAKDIITEIGICL